MDVYEAIRARRTIRDFEDRQVGMGTIERIIDAGLKAPTNNHLRQWEFVIVNGKEERANLLRVENMTSRDECEQMLDGFGMTDKVQRNMYREAMPRQFSMLYNAGCLILPFFKIREPLLQPSSLSSLNDFASIWCCIENMLLAAASEGLLGVTRIPMAEESEHIKTAVGHPENYVMPCYIALGYPAKNASVPAQKAFVQKIKYISTYGNITSWHVTFSCWATAGYPAKGHKHPPRQARPLRFFLYSALACSTCTAQPSHGVVGADHAPDVDGAVDLGNGNADERLFNGPALPGVVARRTVPHGGGYNGVIVDHAVLHAHVVAQRAARRFGKADALPGLRDFRQGEGLRARLQLVQPILDHAEGLIHLLDARHVAPHDREGGVLAYLAERLRADAEHIGKEPLANGRKRLVVDPHARQRADFDPMPGHTRGP